MGLGERLRFEAADMGATFHPAPDKPGLLQRLDVFRRPGKGHSERRGQLADAALALGKSLEDRPPRRIGEGMKHGVEACSLLFNHVVEYRLSRELSQPFG